MIPDSTDSPETYEPHSLGRRGEALAREYLQDQGYEILGQNVRLLHGEVDVIAVDGGCLVFVEVKTRSSARFGSPAEAVDRRKQLRILRAAREFLSQGSSSLSFEGVRFDVVSVVETDRGVALEHFPDAFDLNGAN